MHYQQLDGVAMRSPVSRAPVIADIFMEDLEDKIFEMKNSQDFGLPRLWRRLADGVIASIRKMDGQALLNKKVCSRIVERNQELRRI